MDGLGQRTEDVVLFQRLNQLVLKLVRDGEATVLVHTNRQRVAHFHAVVAAHHVPESLVVLGSRGRTDDALLLAHLRISMHWRRGRSGQLGVHLHLVFQPLDLIAQSLHIRSHLVVLLDSACLDQSVFVSVFLQKSLRLLPEGIALVAQFDNLTHCDLPP